MRPALLVIAILLVPLAAHAPAGIAASEGAGFAIPGSGAILPAAQSTSFGAVYTPSSGYYTGEPNVAVGTDGSVFATGFAYQGTRVFKLSPGASSFTDLGVPDAPYGGNDEAVATGPDGSVWIAGLYGYFTQQGACVSATRSADLGTHWAAPRPGICGAASDRQWIAIDSTGAAWVALREPCCGGLPDGLTLDAYRSIDGGASFQPAGVITKAGWFPGNVFADRAHGLMYATTTCDASAVCLFVTPEAAPLNDWIPLAIIPQEAAPAGLDHVTGAVDADGNIYLAWIDRHIAPAEKQGVYVAEVGPSGAIVQPPTRVSSANVATMPWIAGGAAGKFAVVYYQTASSGVNDPNNANAAVTWNVVATYGSFSGGLSTTVLSPTPNHRGVICTQGGGCGSLNRNLLDFFEAAIGPNGHLYAAYPDDVAGTLRVADASLGLR